MSGKITCVDEGFYICECGYEKHIKGGENSRNGLELVKRLHRKNCRLASADNGHNGRHAYELKVSSNQFKNCEERKQIGELLTDGRKRVGQIKK